MRNQGKLRIIVRKRSFLESLWDWMGDFFLALWFQWGFAMGTNSPTIKGDTTVVWGVGSFSSGNNTLSSTVTGILQSVRDGLTGEVVEVPDQNGFTTAVVLFNHKNECELGVIVQTSAPIFTRGQVLTVGALTNVVLLDYEKMWENKGAAKYTVKGTAWSGMPSP